MFTRDATAGIINRIVPLILLLITTLVAGAAGTLVAFRFPQIAARVELPNDVVGAAEEAARQNPGGARRWLNARRDPETATGLVLSAALLLTTAGGFVLALLAYLIRSNDLLLDADAAVARWGHEHATGRSTSGLHAITQLGGVPVIAVLVALLVIAELRRIPSREIVPFLAVVILANYAVTTGIKDLAGRARPTLNPFAASLGPSFPSGHSSTAAAFYAAAALILARRRSRPARALLAGAAIAVAIAVAATRVLLDDHWLSDVIGGLALGWTVFAICAIAFGGRLLRFGATAEAVSEQAHRLDGRPSTRAPSIDRDGDRASSSDLQARRATGGS